MYDVFIGRGGYWGNPYIIGRDGCRLDVVKKFEPYAREKLWDRLHELRGKVLGCFCYPEMCHGEVLLGLLYERWPADYITDPLTHMTSFSHIKVD